MAKSALLKTNAVVVHAARRVPISWPDRDNGLWKMRVANRFAPAPADSGSWQTYSSVLASPSSSPETGEAETREAETRTAAKANAKK